MECYYTSTGFKVNSELEQARGQLKKKRKKGG
jgi:hypothetical protein